MLKTLMSRDDFTIGWICALPHELTASRAMLDETYDRIQDGIDSKDDNTYNFGQIGDHKVVLACLPAGKYGTESAATVAKDMLRSFPSIRFGLMVGIGGGVPTSEHDIRLGDVVVSKPTETFGGVIQYDLGKILPDGKFERRGHLNKPPLVLLNAIQSLQSTHEMEGSQLLKNLDLANQRFPRMSEQYRHPGVENDCVFLTDCSHRDPGCTECGPHKLLYRKTRTYGQEPQVHYGLIASGNKVIASAEERERLRKDGNILCFEMEAAGLMDVFPCLIIRGICDYADAYKRDEWQRYAAITAAAYARELLQGISGSAIEKATKAKDIAGLQLGQAFKLDESLFVGRESDINALKQYILPGQSPSTQKTAVLAGLGGMGKTQLALQFATLHQGDYTSIWVLDASSATSIKQGLVRMTERLDQLDILVSASDEEEKFVQARKWLSVQDNNRWLVIYDNYDDPHIPPSIKSDTGYDIREYFPFASHGSIIVTTRDSRVKLGKTIELKPLSALEEGIEVLSKRSARSEIKQDPGIKKLATRLNGLPLALAAAGDYLRGCPDSCAQYLESYEEAWAELAEATEMLDYGDRTLYSTWNVSFARLVTRAPEAAELLRLIAYFDHRDIWFELLQQGLASNPPQWLRKIVKSRISFNAAMKKLQEYSFVGLGQDQHSYGLHSCVHDWTFEYLNSEPSLALYRLAVTCVRHACVPNDSALYWKTSRRLEEHGARLGSSRMDSLGEESRVDLMAEFHTIAIVLMDRVKLSEAERMLSWALEGFQTAHGPQHPSTLTAIYELGNLHREQGKLAESERQYTLALEGFEACLGPKDALTLDTLHGLGNTISDQGKLVEAEHMYARALEGKEATLGPKHKSTLRTVNCLGLLYREQGKLIDAENLLLRALNGTEETQGPKNTSTLDFANNLGLLYRDQEKFAEAEQLLLRAMVGYEEVLGPKDTSTLMAVNNLGLLYMGQGKLHDAEQMYVRALEGIEEALGPKHTSTLDSVNNLGLLYREQARLDDAEQLYLRALAGYEEAVGAEHAWSLDVVNSLGILYRDKKNLHKSEQMYLRSLKGRELEYGPHHTMTLDTVGQLGALYRDQGKLNEAEAFLLRALRGKEDAVGPRHTSTLNIANNLGLLFRDQRKLDEAKQMHLRALEGYKAALGAQHSSTIETARLLDRLHLDEKDDILRYKAAL